MLRNVFQLVSLINREKGLKKPVFLLKALFLFSLFVTSCRDINDLEKYRRPEWLAGKLYSQMVGIEDLSSFRKCLELTGYDTIIDKSGSYTVFAPTDEAFALYFTLHPEYNSSVENIPQKDLLDLVRIHIIQDAWTSTQLQDLDVEGWIDNEDPDSKPYAFKRLTILEEGKTRYWISLKNGVIRLSDSLDATGYRMVYSKSGKYVPIFYPEYFTINNLSTDDYSFYFDRDFDPSTIHYVNAKVVSDEIFAENGFIFEVDRVVEPLLNVREVLQSEAFSDKTTYLQEMLSLFPEFTTDLTETYKQPEALAGLDFDTLFILDYPELPYNVHDELTMQELGSDDYTLRYQNGFMAPDDAAFERFISDVLTTSSGYPHYTSWNSVPAEVKKVILKAHMSTVPIYRSSIQEGFTSGEEDIVFLDENAITYKYYGSNATFLGLNEVIVPRAFTSITGPVYLRPGYSTFFYAIEYCKLLPALKKSGVDYSFFILSDNTLENDSTLLLNWIDKNLNEYEFTAFDQSNLKFQKMSTRLLAKRLLNQVGISRPDGSANKEFIENLAGNYIIVDNVNQTVRGGAPSTSGYLSGQSITVSMSEMAEPADNGKTYEVNGWFTPPNYELGQAIQTPARLKFRELLIKAGLYNTKTYTFDFLTDGMNYTIFVPSEQALLDYGVDTMSTESLSRLLRYHFVSGGKIFTDGKQPSGIYTTLRPDETSTTLIKRYTSLRIDTGADFLKLYDPDDNLLGEITEEDGRTNIMITTVVDEDNSSVFNNVTNSVLHDIDFVIHK